MRFDQPSYLPIVFHTPRTSVGRGELKLYFMLYFSFSISERSKPPISRRFCPYVLENSQYQTDETINNHCNICPVYYTFLAKLPS